MAIADNLKDGFTKIQKAELIDEATNQLAGIFAGDQTITGRLDENQKLPHLTYPIDLHGNSEYKNRIQFTALNYKSKRERSKNQEANDKKIIQGGAPISEITSVISLYHPNNLGISHNNEWGTEELGIAGQVIAENPNVFNSLANGGSMSKPIADFVGTAGDKLTKRLVQLASEQTGLNVLGALGKAEGIAQNPRIAMLFKGVNPRNFNFQFSFAPRSFEEVMQVIAIMKAFRYYSAPGFSAISDNQSFFSYPEVFDIKLFHNEEENRALFPYGISACTGIDYDYSPQAVWQTFDNGFPVVVNMTLNFTELDIISKKTIEKEFNK